MLKLLRNVRSLVLVRLISKFAFRSEVLACSSQHTRLFLRLFYEVFRVHAPGTSPGNQILIMTDVRRREIGSKLLP